MLCFGLLSIVFGPLIGFFDVFYDVHIHCTCAALFTIGEVGYVINMVSVLKNHRDLFTREGAQSKINTLIMLRGLIVIQGIVTYGAKLYQIDIGAGSSIIEWSVFHETFYIFAILPDIMPFELKVVRAD